MNKAFATILNPLVAKVTALETKVNLMRDKTRIYMSDTDENPADIYGGTWERIKSSFLWGMDDGEGGGLTGGEKTHTLSVDEMPSHNHSPSYASNGNWVPANDTISRNRYNIVSGGSHFVPSGDSLEDWKWGKTSLTGGSQPHNNMPPYYGVYIWIRKD